MIYLKTNNRSIAGWLKAKDTMFLLDCTLGHYNLQMCLSMLLSMLMAGSGDLKVLELCRVLQKRTRTMTHHMALGGGRYTPTRPSLPCHVRSTTSFLPTAQLTDSSKRTIDTGSCP
uniref:anaphase-promoting complex subunit 1 isoform X2 n=1 Tax=Oncorhynchus gorbuscha TaxID=8017 RepID=UPI001EAF24A7|nr:anaphase-promoting complex subunit 1 isoform X2 [Oncorhynchus gorbuscha]